MKFTLLCLAECLVSVQCVHGASNPQERHQDNSNEKENTTSNLRDNRATGRQRPLHPLDHSVGLLQQSAGLRHKTSILVY